MAVGEDGATAWNVVMQHPAGAVVTLHVVVLDPDANGVLGPPDAGNATYACVESHPMVAVPVGERWLVSGKPGRHHPRAAADPHRR